MSTTVNNVTYTRIDTTNTAKVSGFTSTCAGVVVVVPSVLIGSVSCKVVEVATGALNGCSQVTDIVLPNTIETLKDACIGNTPLIKRIVIPASVTKVETFFLADMNPEEIYFCGTKEPEMINTRKDNYIASAYTGVITVPLNYDSSKTTFCKKSIKRQNIEYCSIIKQFGDKTISKIVYLKWCTFCATAAATKL